MRRTGQTFFLCYLGIQTWLLFEIIVMITPPAVVHGFSLVSSPRQQITDAKWTMTPSVSLSQAIEPSSDVPESSRDEDSSTTTMTNIQMAAWCLSQQLIMVLQREELSWRIQQEEDDDDDLQSMGRIANKKRKKTQQMIRWLNTRLLFGCTALEWVQQQAASTTTMDYDNYDYNYDKIGEDIQEELQAMLDFSEFSSPFLDDEGGEEYFDCDDNFAQEFGTANNVSSEDERELDSSEAQMDNVQEESQSGASLPIFDFGKPLEIVQSDVPPLRNCYPMTAVTNTDSSNLRDSRAIKILADEEEYSRALLFHDRDTTDEADAMIEHQEDDKEDDGLWPETSSSIDFLDDQPTFETSNRYSIKQTPEIQSNSNMEGTITEPLTPQIIPMNDDDDDDDDDDENERLGNGLDHHQQHQQLILEATIHDIDVTEGKDAMPANVLTKQSEEMDSLVVQDGPVVDEEPSSISTSSALSHADKMKLYKASAVIAHSFPTNDFDPPIWTRNGNLQTIGGFLARGKNPALVEFEWDERKRMETPDGDFFVVDWKFSDLDEHVGRPSSEVPLVLLCHGLQSNSDSNVAKDMARAFNSVGMDVACINFRGCSDEINRGPLGYHLGFTDDLKLMLEHVSQSRNGSKLYLSGFSLGANVVTKLLAELKTDALTKYNIRGAAVNALPFDFLKVGPNFSDEGLTKSLYGDGLLKSLTERVLENYDDQNYTFSKEELMDCKTLREFDDLVVCDVYDFDGVDDYHRKCSTISVLDQVAVPELVIQALDDPFFQGNTNPTNNPSQPLRIQYTEHGGHCGYWRNEGPDHDATWMPLQLAKFLKHVDEQQSSLHALYDVESEGHDNPADVDDTRKQDLAEERRQRAALVSHSFQVKDYRPALYATNAHVQTVMGALYRKETMYASSDLPSFLSGISKFKGAVGGDGFQWENFHWDRRQRLETPDDDFFDVDWKTSGVNFASDDTPLVIICHGLQASSDSPLVKDMAEAFLGHGMGAACMNFRGCGGEVNRTPRGYHLGFTDDLHQLVTHVNTVYPNKRIYLSAFSLGANVVTSFLANLGSDAQKYSIAGAAVNALPYEVSKSTMNLNSDGITKTLYADRILESMYERIEEMYDYGIDFPFEREAIRDCKTIMDMENLVIAPFFDFEDAWDYYDKTSTLRRLDEVAVPELVIQSEDDPFLLGQSHVANKADRPLRIHYTKHGGHCGHVFHATDHAYPTSWMPTELARFLAHVDLSLKVDKFAFSSQYNQNTEKEILN
ncbi:unnamed protein product [Cylindrotheca closterium]|uniref:Serine aminopeptidase S33 domain-containing protein n=1 Tax=Cylindrotheca closterium TaxID=2856 RepID=A0AAD2JKM0_9STRA|nr:unnamed protein product [Cylindrotheca closterium]